MTLFHYRAVNAQNAEVSAEMEAASPSEVADRLIADGLTPISVDPGPHRSSRDFVRTLEKALGAGSGAKAPTRKDLTSLLAQLADLVEAGIRVDAALKIISVSAAQQRTQKLAAGLSAKLGEGLALAEALRSEAPQLPEYARGLIAAGEASGTLDQVLRSLSETFRQGDEIRGKILTALIYPSLLLVMIGLAIGMIFVMVLPEFRRIFESARAPIPAQTQFLLDVSDFFAFGWPYLLVLTLALAAAIVYALQQEEWRVKLDAALLRLPGVSDLEVPNIVTQFCRAMALLLGSGFTLTESLSLATAGVRNRGAKAALGQIIQQLREGARLSDSLKELAFFPRESLEVLRIGEETGRLAPMFGKVAVLAEKQLNERTDRFVALLTPSLTIVMGLLVAAVVVSLLSGIMSLNSLV
jgi:general secretion pathway protein F